MACSDGSDETGGQSFPAVTRSRPPCWSWIKRPCRGYFPSICSLLVVLKRWVHGWMLLCFVWRTVQTLFVGTFIARNSKGPTIREFIIGALTSPRSSVSSALRYSACWLPISESKAFKVLASRWLRTKPGYLDVATANGRLRSSWGWPRPF